MLVASKVENLPSKFGHARPLGSRIIRYVRDRLTERRTDTSNTYCPLPYRRSHNITTIKRITRCSHYKGAVPQTMLEVKLLSVVR